jgi:hypothetical protein
MVGQGINIDEEATAYNAHLDTRLSESRWRSFLRGMGSVFIVGGSSVEGLLYAVNPIYARTDLTPEQKNAIALRADFLSIYSDSKL